MYDTCTDQKLVGILGKMFDHCYRLNFIRGDQIVKVAERLGIELDDDDFPGEVSIKSLATF